MSALPTIAGAFSRVYVGDFGSGSKLSLIPSVRTADITPDVSAATDYVAGMNIYAQAGNQIIKFDIHYYTDSNIPFLLCRNTSVAGAITDTPVPSTKYVVFLLNTDTTKESYLFPEISCRLDMKPNYEKEKPTVITNSFYAENPNLAYTDPNLNCKLMYAGTPSAIKAILGSRSPI